MGGYVNSATTKKNLFWVIAIAALLAFHGCVRLAWMQEKDDEEHHQDAPAAYRD